LPLTRRIAEVLLVAARNIPSIAALSALAILVSGSVALDARGADVENLTGLPLFPSINYGAMDRVSKTDTLGRWCSRFAAETSYSLEQVEVWYRKALLRASETDLADDDSYKTHAQLTGVKLALGIDFVAIFRADSRPNTSIELIKCSPP